MLCPACLTFDVNRDANTTVAGTVYCAQHGVEALALLNSPDPAVPRTMTSRRPRPMRTEQMFTPPTPE